VCNSDGHGGAQLVLERPGQPRKTWVSSNFMGNTEEFEAWRGDLDGDGREELVLATLDAISNDMGVSTWSIYVLGESDRSPLIFEVQEYGPGSLIWDESAGTATFLATTWTTDAEPRRGTGLYFLGRWFKYRQGTLVADTGRAMATLRRQPSCQSWEIGMIAWRTPDSVEREREPSGGSVVRGCAFGLASHSQGAPLGKRARSSRS